MFIIPFMWDYDTSTNYSNYFGYMFNKEARDMIKKIREIANEDGLFKLETKLEGNEKLRRQIVGNVKHIKGVLINNMYTDNSHLYLDLAKCHEYYDVVAYSKPADKLPNRFLKSIEKANEKWAKRNSSESLA